MRTAELHTLTGAYALDAVSAEERDEFEKHLRACSFCAQEVAELRATAARLGQAVSEQPPAELRDRVLRRIGEVRQEAPGGRAVEEAATARAPHGRRRSWPIWALAACVAAAGALGGVAVWQHQEAQDARQRSERAQDRAEALARVLSASDARAVSGGELPGGGSSTVVLSQSQNRAALVVSGMPPPPKGKVYQLWLSDDGRMRPAGLMHPGSGSEAALLEGGLDGASGMGVTVEPDGGSPQPTSEPVMLVDFPA
ncbi:anti-sigma factor [Streptomyces sp. WMMB303]|uniref:anti-sigma factor n=1 Tax=Streptomyces sp. WMMB303 TaxID=3034154 RepID=UPI0023EBA55C|nr:anti-sigma factor [Streptomyces sp. WMMB303]MDF4252010.1 anti-sigma factor [Streptomyces sp. WMMB303]